MKKKVVLVDVFYLLTAITGIKTYTVELWRGLKEQKNDELEFRAVPDFDKALRMTMFREKPSYMLRLLYHVLYFFWKQIVLPVYSIFYKADVILSPDFISPVWKTKALKASVIHDSLFWDYPANYNKYWRKYYLGMLRFGLRGRSMVITTSHYSKQMLAPHLPAHVPVEVVYQNPSHNILSIKTGEASTVLRTLGLESKMYVLHTGFFDPRKNLPKLVEAFAVFLEHSENKGMRLVLAGEPGPETEGSVYWRVKETARQLGISELVIFPGYVSSTDLKELYTHASMYVFPSVDEGFGIPVLEAMAHDVPVVVSNRGSLMEIGGNAVISFDPANHHEIAAKMIQVQNDQALRADLIKKGQVRLKSFSREKFAAQAVAAITKYWQA